MLRYAQIKRYAQILKLLIMPCLVYVYEVAKVDKPEIYIGYC